MHRWNVWAQWSLSCALLAFVASLVRRVEIPKEKLNGIFVDTQRRENV